MDLISHSFIIGHVNMLNINVKQEFIEKKINIKHFEQYINTIFNT